VTLARIGTRRPGRGGAPGHADPLLRNGHVLTLGSLVTSALGAGYWALASRWYGDAEVGRSYAAVSAMMLLAGVGQLGLANVLVRFLPAGGPAVRRGLVRAAYAAASGATACAALVFVLAVPAFTPGLSFLRRPDTAVCFVLATTAYALFALQDGALTGVRRPALVVGKNSAFALAKLLCVAALASALPTLGILMSWALALVVTLVVVDVWLFARVLPGRGPSTTRPVRAARPIRSVPPTPVPPTPAAPPVPRVGAETIARFAGADHLGTMCWLAATTLPPIIVLEHSGAARSAYFSLAWVVANTLHLISLNMAASLVVETADDPAGLRARCRRVLTHTGALLAVAITALALGAPLVLRVFGPDHARNATTLLRILALSALPHLVVATALGACRALGRMRAVVAIQAGLAATALTLTALLLPMIGVLGAGVAWLCAQSATALTLLGARRVWLPPAHPAPPPPDTTRRTA